MINSRFLGGAVAMLAMFAADHAFADTGESGGNVAVLNTFSKVWVSGEGKGPLKIAKNTGAGTMDAHFGWDKIAYAKDNTKVQLVTCYTRSDSVENANDNGYMQGGFALATLGAKGVTLGQEIALPKLNGERTFMRPTCAFVNNFVVVMAASEDNGVNDNPQPVLYLADKQTGALRPITNNTQGDNINKPTNLIKQAQRDGVNVQDPNNQRGPHSLTCDGNSCVVGMQYNNAAFEAFKFTVSDSGAVNVNWLKRYSDDGTHCRPQVALQPGSQSVFFASVEGNNQPAEVGVRLVEASLANGEEIQNKVVFKSEPEKKIYLSSPNISILNNENLVVTYGMSNAVRNKGDGKKGHAGGMAIDVAAVVRKSDLSVVGSPQLGVGQYGRHGGSFVTKYGPSGDPALAVISGSSTGTGAGFLQVYPLKADGTLGVKDPLKVYMVSQFSDVANVQARGKRNPQDQARGFINGLGDVPNPGFTTDAAAAKTNFMPEVKSFSFSTVTGYSGPEARAAGLKNSVWLSLVPATWQEGLQTIPGTTTDNGTGPAPRTQGEGTDPSGDADDDADGRKRAFNASDSGCACDAAGSSSGTSALAPLGLAMAGLLVAARRRRSAKKVQEQSIVKEA